MPCTTKWSVGAWYWLVERVWCRLYMRVMYVEGAGCRSSGVGMSSGTWCLELLREAILVTHVSRSHSLVLLGGAGWGVGHVGIAVAGVALGVLPLRHGVSD